ncbi:hypothetical protein RRG08_042178 [Elysia crispata]|uniref:PiggyBac transposable element-derived protein domain-containing protein n=1 Tax=Elysia crispata TaxID=231223 RepID=A0AAE0Z5Q8_9GAST|nr:hypothetical protein RRG08_042178 [Elysia crispata]
MNRLKECQLSSEKEMKQAGRGAVDSLVETKSGCVVVRWFDNRTVDLLSSYIGPEPLTKVKRYDKKQKSMISVECPAVVIEYNKFMGGIDLHDSLTALYRYHIKSRRWYMYIFFYTLNMMVVNAWLRHRHHARLLKISSMKLSKFQVMQSNQLIKPSKVGRPSLGNTPPAPKHVYRRKIPAPELRLDHMSGKHEDPIEIYDSEEEFHIIFERVVNGEQPDVPDVQETPPRNFTACTKFDCSMLLRCLERLIRYTYTRCKIQRKCFLGANTVLCLENINALIGRRCNSRHINGKTTEIDSMADPAVAESSSTERSSTLEKKDQHPLTNHHVKSRKT